MPRREKAIFEVSAEDRASRTIRKVRDEFGGLGKAASALKLPKFAAMAKGAGLAAGAVAGAATAVGAMVKALAPYNKAINEARSLTGESAASFADLRDQVLGLSAELGADPAEQAKALYEALSAGVPRDNAISFLRTSTRAAVAGLTETKTAVDGITTVINAYNLQTSEAEKIADAYFATIEKGKTNFEQLASSINLAIKPAANLGVEYEEILAITAQLTAGGTPTASAFTQIRAALTALQNPSKEMAELLRRQGFESGRAAIESQGLAVTLQKLKDEAANDQELVKALGRVEALGAVLGVSGIQAESFADKYARVLESAGAASAAFEINSDNLDNALQRVKSSFLIVADAADEYIGSLIGYETASAAAIDQANSFADALGKVKRELELNKLLEESAAEQAQDVSLEVEFLNLETELAKLKAFGDEIGGEFEKQTQARLDELKKRLSIDSEEAAEFARNNAKIELLKRQREASLVSLNNEPNFAIDPNITAGLDDINERIRIYEDLNASIVALREFDAAAQSTKDTTEEQADAQSQVNALLAEFIASSKTKEDIAREELKTQEDKYRVLLEEGRVSEEQFNNFLGLQREKLGLLDEEGIKRQQLAEQQEAQAKREAERLKADNERLAGRFLDRVKTDQERLVEDLAEVSRLQQQGFLTEDQGTLLGRRFREEFSEVIGGFEEMESAAERFLDRVKTPLERFQDEIREVRELMATDLLSDAQGSLVIERLTEQFQQGAGEIRTVWQDTVGVLRSSFSTFLRGGVDDFGKFVASIVAEAAAIQADRLLFGEDGVFEQLFGGGQASQPLTIDVTPVLNRNPAQQVSGDYQFFEDLKNKAAANLEEFDSLGQIAGVNFGDAFSAASAPPISKGLQEEAVKAKDILSGVRVDVDPRQPSGEFKPLVLPVEPGIDPGAFDLLGGQSEEISLNVFQAMEGAGANAAQSIGASFEESNQSILSSLADMAKGAANILANLAKRTLSFLGDIFGGNSSGGGLNLGSLFSSLLDFDGGGFTGFGPRTGGVDGFGGFPAILHPNEQVIDLSRNQSAGGAGGLSVNQTLNIQPGVSQEMIPQILSAAKEGTMAAIRDQGLRGGRRGRTLGF